MNNPIVLMELRSNQQLIHDFKNSIPKLVFMKNIFIDYKID